MQAEGNERSEVPGRNEHRLENEQTLLLFLFVFGEVVDELVN